MRGTCGVLKRVFSCTWHTWSDKREFKEFFQYVSPHDLARKCEMCDFTDFVTLATLDTIPVLKKLPLKRVFGYAQHTWSVKREFKESFQLLAAHTE